MPTYTKLNLPDKLFYTQSSSESGYSTKPGAMDPRPRALVSGKMV